jgi:hypothetical protein
MTQNRTFRIYDSLEPVPILKKLSIKRDFITGTGKRKKFLTVKENLNAF